MGRPDLEVPLLVTLETIRQTWAQRGLELDGRVEELSVYSPVLVMPDDEPSQVSARWTSQLEAAGFHTLDPSESGDELGVLPGIMALPHVFGAAMRRGTEIVVHYAMRGGLAERGQIPCRASLTLLTSELLGPWAGRGLERAGCVELVSDEQLVFRPGRDPGETFDVVRQAFLSSGAEVAANEADRARAYADHLGQRMRRTGLSRREVEVALAELPIPRQLTLVDTRGTPPSRAALTGGVEGGIFQVEPTSPARCA